MTAREFCYWLQGYFELLAIDLNKGVGSMSMEQTSCIQRHLAMVFKHEIDPSAGPQPIQDALNHLHTKPIDGTLIRC